MSNSKAYHRAYGQWLGQLLADVFESSEDVWHWSVSRLADEAFVSRTTVYNLKNRKTTDPRSSTVFKLCKAVGMDMRLVKLPRQQRKAA